MFIKKFLVVSIATLALIACSDDKDKGSDSSELNFQIKTTGQMNATEVNDLIALFEKSENGLDLELFLLIDDYESDDDKKEREDKEASLSDTEKAMMKRVLDNCTIQQPTKVYSSDTDEREAYVETSSISGDSCPMMSSLRIQTERNQKKRDDGGYESTATSVLEMEREAKNSELAEMTGILKLSGAASSTGETSVVKDGENYIYKFKSESKLNADVVLPSNEEMISEMTVASVGYGSFGESAEGPSDKAESVVQGTISFRGAKAAISGHIIYENDEVTKSKFYIEGREINMDDLGSFGM